MSSPSAAHASPTRTRLLQAGGEVFAREGFERATVREIAREAGANVAAINYHFGDKDALYLETLREAHRYVRERFPLLPEAAANAPPRTRLKLFIRSFLSRYFDANRPAWHRRLLAAELSSPTRALDVIVEENARNNRALLEGIMAGLVREPLPPRVLRRCGSSIIAQCMFYRNGRPVLDRLYGTQVDAASELDELVEHILEFSLAGIRAAERAARSLPTRRRRKSA